MDVILVFSDESSKPRIRRKVSTTGLTLFSSSSLLAPVMTKSSAYMLMLTLSCLETDAFIVSSRPLSVAFRSAGDMIPPYSKKVIMQTNQRLSLIFQSSQ